MPTIVHLKKGSETPIGEKQTGAPQGDLSAHFLKIAEQLNAAV